MAQVADVFTPSRERAATDHMKASASELLMMFPLLREFAVVVVQPTRKLDRERISLLACCDVIDALLDAKRAGRREDILPRMVAFLGSHIAAYGHALLRPKHHYAMHNALQISGPSLDCWVHERKHQVVKRCAEPIRNTISFEASLLGRVLLEQTRQLNATRNGRGLEGPIRPSLELAAAFGGQAEVLVAKSGRFGGLQVGVDDCVLFGAQAALVRACAQVGAELFLVVQMLAKTGDGRSSSRWALQADYAPSHPPARPIHIACPASPGGRGSTRHFFPLPPERRACTPSSSATRRSRCLTAGR